MKYSRQRPRRVQLRPLPALATESASPDHQDPALSIQQRSRRSRVQKRLAQVWELTHEVRFFGSSQRAQIQNGPDEAILSGPEDPRDRHVFRESSRWELRYRSG
jgi:hypothetical protein